MIFISVLLWNLDFYLISDDMLKFVRALDGVNNDEIFKTKAIKVFVNYLWKKSRRFHFGLVFVYSIYMLLLSIYAATNNEADENNVALEVILFGGSIGFLVYEIL